MESQGRDHLSHGVHFFKVILESTLQKGEMKVPRSFHRRHWQGMGNPVFLRFPNSTEFKVYWMNEDGDILFKNGWREFAESSCLDVSHFVVFRYEGNSRFNVIVFDKSALEIQYPSNKGTNQEEDENDASDCKIVKECSLPEDKRPKSLSSSSHTRKKMKINPKEEQEEEIKHEQKKTGCSKRDFRKIIRTFHEKVKKTFRSDNECFTCPIHKSYAERDLLILPNEFAKLRLHGDSATLFINECGKWDVELKVNSSGNFTIATGWRKFLMDNNLKIGDVCAFELIQSKAISLKVTIFPLEEDSSTPIFKVPFTRLKGLIKENGRYVTFQFGKKEWNVKVLFYERNYSARLSLGWPEFVNEGDVCHFKLIDVENFVFKVSISKREPRN
ncbi:hypothetical protein VNO77_42081 [Canavalia gladiata]|uniref:TF-B3 domain-containing protein n=1 Tax=Canavalia gladiata TaxID=3824 RepID=A0AAN9K1Q3_CANGL